MKMFLSVLLCVSVLTADAKELRLNLSAAANRGFVDEVAGDGEGGWSDQGPDSSLYKFVPGDAVFGGVPFRTIDPGKNNGRSVLVFEGTNDRNGLREAVIPVASEAATPWLALYLLHTGCWVRGKDKDVGTIEVQYAEGEPVVFRVASNHELNNWWNPNDCENGFVAYQEEHGHAVVGLYLSRFPLPARRGPIRRVVLRTAGQATWIVVGATLLEEDRPLPQRQPWTVEASEQWKPMDLSDVVVKPGTALDFSWLVEPGPAGQHGYVMINAKGQLAFEKQPDKPLRFLGGAQNIDLAGWTTEELEELAEQVRRAGYRMYRPHFLDHFLMRGSREDLVFNPKNLDLWDRFAAALKKRGVYLYLDATTSWAPFYATPNPWSDQIKAIRMKTRLYYDPEARAHWKAGVTKLFEHVNPYTGVALKDEPQVAVIALRNEPSLNFQMVVNPDPNLVGAFRQWLKRRYGTTERLREAWTVRDGDARKGFLKADETIEAVALPPLSGVTPDVQDLQRFFLEVEVETFEWMKSVMQELGVRSVLFDYNNCGALEASLARDAVPVVCTHGYHDHPSEYVRRGSTQSATSSLPGGLWYVQWLAGRRHWGRPLLVSEWGHVFWNPWRHEGGVAAPSYAALQDWQLLMQHAAPVALRVKEPVKSFTVVSDPAVKPSEYMAALLFERGDVAASPHKVDVVLEPEAVFTKLGGESALPASLTRAALVCGLGISTPPGPASAPRAPYKADVTVRPEEALETEVVGGAAGAGAERAKADRLGADPKWKSLLDQLRYRKVLPNNNRTDAEAGIFESDTGELLLDTRVKRLQVITPRSEAITLPATREPLRLKQLEVRQLSVPAAVFVGALDDQPIEQSSRLLLLVSTDALNTRMSFKDEHRRALVEVGRLPVLVRTVEAQLALRHRRADQLQLWALAANGTRQERISVKAADGIASFQINTGALTNGPTPYFELVEQAAKEN